MQMIEKLLAMQKAVQPTGIENFVNTHNSALQIAKSTFAANEFWNFFNQSQCVNKVHFDPTFQSIRTYARILTYYNKLKAGYLKSSYNTYSNIQQIIADGQSELNYVKKIQTLLSRRPNNDHIVSCGRCFDDLEAIGYGAHSMPILVSPLLAGHFTTPSSAAGKILLRDSLSYLQDDMFCRDREKRTGTLVAGNTRNYVNQSILDVLQNLPVNPMPVNFCSKPGIKILEQNKEVQQLFKLFQTKSGGRLILAAIKDLIEQRVRELKRHIKCLFKKLNTLFSIDRRYLIRTVIRSFRLTTFDGKDDNNFDGFKIDYFKKDQVVSFFKTAKTWLTNRNYCYWCNTPSLY